MAPDVFGIRSKYYTLLLWSLALVFLAPLIDLVFWLLIFCLPFSGEPGSIFILEVLGITFLLISFFALFIVLGCNNPNFHKAVETLGFELSVNYMYLKEALTAKDTRAIIQYSDALEATVHMTTKVENIQMIKQERTRFLIFKLVKKIITMPFMRSYRHFLMNEAKQFQERLKAIYTIIDRKIIEENLADASIDLKNLSDVPNVFCKGDSRRFLNVVIKEKASIIESKREILAKELESGFNNVRLMYDKGISITQVVPLIVHMENKARSAGLNDDGRRLYELFITIQKRNRSLLKDRLVAVKTKAVQRDIEINFLAIKNELGVIYENSRVLEIAELENESRYWLENVLNIKKLMDAFRNTSHANTVQYLQVIMGMDKAEFAIFLLDWAKPLNLQIENDFVRFQCDEVSSMVEKIDIMFATWKENEKYKEKRRGIEETSVSS